MKGFQLVKSPCADGNAWCWLFQVFICDRKLGFWFWSRCRDQTSHFRCGISYTAQGSSRWHQCNCSFLGRRWKSVHIFIILVDQVLVLLSFLHGHLFHTFIFSLAWYCRWYELISQFLHQIIIPSFHLFKNNNWCSSELGSNHRRSKNFSII